MTHEAGETYLRFRANEGEGSAENHPPFGRSEGGPVGDLRGKIIVDDTESERIGPEDFMGPATTESDTDDLPEFEDLVSKDDSGDTDDDSGQSDRLECGVSGCAKEAIATVLDVDKVLGDDPNRCLDCLEYHLRENYWNPRK